MLILERPWTRQPQLPVRLRDSFSDATFVYSPAQPLERISGAQWLRSGVTRQPDKSGIVETIATTGGSANYLSLAASSAMNLLADGHTLLLLTRLIADSSSFYDRIWTRDVATTAPNNCYGFLVTAPGDPQPHRIYFTSKSNAGVQTSIGYTTANPTANRQQSVLYALVYKAGTGTLYVNGRPVDSAAYTSVAASSLTMYVGRPSGATNNGAAADVSLAVIIPRALHSSVIAKLADNPNFLWADKQIIIPTAAAAAGAPTITALSARSITATSAQPRISYS